MKNKIFTLLILTTFFSVLHGQQEQNFLSIAAVSEDGLVIPAGRFVGGELFNIQIDTSSWKDFESSVVDWYYYPYESKATKLKTGGIIDFTSGGDGVVNALKIFSDSNGTVNLRFPNKIVGIASNKPIRVFQNTQMNIKESSSILDYIPTKLLIDKKLYQQLRSNFPNFSFGDTLNFVVTYIDSFRIDSTIYYRYQTESLLRETFDHYDFIMKSGWLVYRNNKFELFENELVCFSYKNDIDEDIEMGKNMETLGIILYQENLYNIYKTYVWKDISYELKKIIFNKN